MKRQYLTRALCDLCVSAGEGIAAGFFKKSPSKKDLTIGEKLIADRIMTPIFRHRILPELAAIIVAAAEGDTFSSMANEVVPILFQEYDSAEPVPTREELKRSFTLPDDIDDDMRQFLEEDWIEDMDFLPDTRQRFHDCLQALIEHRSL